MVGRQPECEHPFARSILGQVWSTWPERTRGSVFVNLEVRLAFLASPLVQAVLSGDDFTADDLQAGPSPSPSTSARRWSTPRRCAPSTGS